MHGVYLTQNLEGIKKLAQKMDSVTGSMLWVRMALFHAITTTRAMIFRKEYVKKQIIILILITG